MDGKPLAYNDRCLRQRRLRRSFWRSGGVLFALSRGLARPTVEDYEAGVFMLILQHCGV